MKQRQEEEEEQDKEYEKAMEEEQEQEEKTEKELSKAEKKRLKKERKQRKKEMKEREKLGLLDPESFPPDPIISEREVFPPGYAEWQLARQRAEMGYVHSAMVQEDHRFIPTASTPYTGGSPYGRPIHSSR